MAKGEIKGSIDAGEFKNKKFLIKIGNTAYTSEVYFDGKKMSSSIDKIILKVDANKSGLWEATFHTVCNDEYKYRFG